MGQLCRSSLTARVSVTNTSFGNKDYDYLINVHVVSVSCESTGLQIRLVRALAAE